MKPTIGLLQAVIATDGSVTVPCVEQLIVDLNGDKLTELQPWA